MKPPMLQYKTRASTLLEWCIMLSAIGIGIAASMYLRGKFGFWIGIAGFFVGLFGFLSLIIGSYFLWSWISGARCPLPVCRNGCCHQNQYLKCRGDLTLFKVVCPCGDTYVKTGRVFPRFMIVNPDNSHTPYMRYVPCLGWRKDAGKGTGPCW